MTLPEMLAVSGTGFIIVFAVLALLMSVIMIMSLFNKKEKTAAPAPAACAAAPAAAAPAVAPSNAKPAPGSCGGVVLNGVEEKTAAMLMAITADTLGEPLNELRFISIKEIRSNSK